MKLNSIFNFAAACVALVAVASCGKNHGDDIQGGNRGDNDPVKVATEGLSVVADYYGDYYECGFDNYNLVFQIGEVNEDNEFVGRGVELCLDLLVSQGGKSYFPAGVYTITNTNYNSAGIIPSVPTTYKEYLEANGTDTSGYSAEVLNAIHDYGYTYLYTQQDSENYWLDPVDDATLEISVNGAQYSISIDFKSNGESFSYYYKGALPINDRTEDNPGGEDPDPETPDGPDGDYTMKCAGIEVYNYGHQWNDNTDDYMIYLDTTDEDEYIEIELITASGNKTELATGTYTIPTNFENMGNDDFKAGMLCPIYKYSDYYYGTFLVYGGYIWYSADTGTVTVSKSGDNYTIEASFYDEQYDAVVTSKYIGAVNVDIEDYYEESTSVLSSKKMPAGRSIRKAAPSRRPEAVKAPKSHKSSTVAKSL